MEEWRYLQQTNATDDEDSTSAAESWYVDFL